MNDFFPAAIIAITIGFFAGLIVHFTDDASWRQQIAAHGCAEFYLDGNHNVQWKWKECK
jgi:hypothetical protein